MGEPLESLYFQWLCAKVIYVREPTPSLTYWDLLRILYRTEFVWLLSGDDNRAADGVELRIEFLLECDIPDNIPWRNLPCSILEMLIAMSKRAEFNTGEPYRDWFWEFIDNLGLKEFTDGSGFDPRDVEDALDQFIWRTYNRKGEGGIFPLNSPNHDQREVEIWYQFCDYLLDHNRLP